METVRGAGHDVRGTGGRPWKEEREGSCAAHGAFSLEENIDVASFAGRRGASWRGALHRVGRGQVLMPVWEATGRANSNLAFIKYWGNADNSWRLPLNGSISMTLGGLFTETHLAFSDTFEVDAASINGHPAGEGELARISSYLDFIRAVADVRFPARIVSINNFPARVGVGSSASAFAAIAVAADAALDLGLSERELSSLARVGSGSAARSIPGGFVEWHQGTSHDTSFAETIAPADHWALTDVIAIVSHDPKRVGSSEGHLTSGTSVLQAARVRTASDRLARCREALDHKDFCSLAEVSELDSNILHSVMMTSVPPLIYWLPSTIAVMQDVIKWRSEGIEVFYSVDAGANVHCVCGPGYGDEIATRLERKKYVVAVATAHLGGPAMVTSSKHSTAARFTK